MGCERFFFRTPENTKDAKRQLQKLAKGVKKAAAERADAEASQYPLGVRLAQDRIEELECAQAHFQRWLKDHA